MSIQGQWGANESFNKYFGVKLLKNCGWYHQGKTSWWLGEEKSYLYSRNWLIKQLKKDPEYGKKYFNYHYSRLLNFTDNFSELLANAKNCPPLEAGKRARGFIRKATDLIAPAFFTDWYAYEAQNWIYQYIPKSKMSADVFRQLTGARKMSFVQTYQYQLALIKLKKGNISISALSKKMAWVKDNYYFYATVNPSVVKEDLRRLSLKEAREILTLPARIQKNNQVQDALLDSLDLNDFQKSLIRLLSDFVDLQDSRKLVFFCTNNLAWQYFNIILKNFGATSVEKKFILLNASADWIINLPLKTIISNSRLAEAGMLRLTDQKPTFGAKANLIFRRMSGEANSKDAIRGYAAHLGKVEGRVKVIHSLKDFDKFTRGDILVASMTRPEFMPLIKNAAAIVTDEGGITCHAAIVSREFKKPCIIGTKNATRILKDGDLVEVDADKGVVRIIK